MPQAAPQDHQARLDQAYADWLDDVDTLKVFDYAIASHAGRGGFVAGFKSRDEDAAKLIVMMGELAQDNPALLDVARAVIAKTNPHTSVREFAVQAFRAARDVLEGVYDDVTKRAGPEPFRYKDCLRPYRRHEKVAVLETLRLAIDNGCVPSLGWCVRRFYREGPPERYPYRMPPAVRRQAKEDDDAVEKQAKEAERKEEARQALMRRMRGEE